jgi:hypothetical protein
MDIFYAEGPGPRGDVEAFDKETLLPDRTTLAQALRANGLEFDAWDFTQADYEHARLKKQVIEMLRPDLEAEGNGFLYENRHDEAVGVMSAIDAGLHVRYLYSVSKR